MVDKGRRRTIRNVGAGIALLLGGGGGAALYGDEAAEWVAAEKEAYEQRQEERREREQRQERREHRRRQREQVEEWSREIEAELADDMADRYNWADAEVAMDDVSVTYEEVREDEEGGLVYTFTVNGPLRDDSPIAICDYAETREDERQLADLLEREAVVLHQYLYAWLDKTVPSNRGQGDLRVISFTTAFEDETGRAEATLDWKTAERVAQGNDFQPDYWHERQAYTQEYQLAFTVECENDG